MTRYIVQVNPNDRDAARMLCYRASSYREAQRWVVRHVRMHNLPAGHFTIRRA